MNASKTVFIEKTIKERKKAETFRYVFRFTNKETGVTFEGTRAQYCEKEGIAMSTLDGKLRKGTVSRIKIGREDDFEFVKKDKKRQIARKQFREKISYLAYLQDIGEL